jgi:hypothetical protein
VASLLPPLVLHVLRPRPLLVLRQALRQPGAGPRALRLHLHAQSCILPLLLVLRRLPVAGVPPPLPWRHQQRC